MRAKSLASQVTVPNEKRLLRLLVSPALALLILGSMSALAQNQDRLLTLKAKRLIDGTGRGVIENAVVLVRGQKIELVGTEEEVRIPEDSTVIDLGDQTLLPGLIDTQSYPFQRPDPRGYEGVLKGYDQTPVYLQMGRAVRNMRTNLLLGVTTVFVAGEVGFGDVYLAETINAGVTPGPRVLSSGLGLTTTDGRGPSSWQVDGLENLRTFVRRNLKQGSHHLKISLQDISPDETLFTEEELKAIVREISRHRRQVSAAASGRWGSSIEKALESGIVHLENPSPLNPTTIALISRHNGTVSEDLLSKYAYFVDDLWDFHDNQVVTRQDWIDKVRESVEKVRQGFTPEGLVWTPWLREQERVIRSDTDRLNAILAAHKAGVPVTLGQGNLAGTQSLQVEYLVKSGFAPLDAIAAATSVAAEAIGMGDQIGTIEEGKFADIISVKGNPLDDIKALSQVDLILVAGKNYRALTWW